MYWPLITFATLCLAVIFGLLLTSFVGKIKWLLLAGGIALIALNIAGLFHSLRSLDIGRMFSPDNHISMDWNQLKNILNDPTVDPVALNNAVHQGTFHYFGDEGDISDAGRFDRYFLRVPPTENFLLYTCGFLFFRYCQKYEFVDPYRAAERGFGLCSQRSMIVSAILNIHGIPAEVIGLDGHVVVSAKYHGQDWVLDPEYGVSIPFPASKVVADPDLISTYYQKAGVSTERISELKMIFAPQGNGPYGRDYSKLFDRFNLAEELAYALKWGIPVFLLIPALPLKRKKDKKDGA